MVNEQSEISRLQQVDTLGLEYFRTVVLLNGGAILALLTFMGNASDGAAVQFSLASVKAAMSAFLVGIVVMLIALIISYSYTATGPGYRYRDYWDKKIIAANAVLASVSLIAFVCGVANLISGAASP